MSADNGYILRKNSAGEYVLQMYFASNDEYPEIDRPNAEKFGSFVEALKAYEKGCPTKYRSEYGLLIDCGTTTHTNKEEESHMLNVQTYVRKPFEVNAAQVTEENMELVASWCGGVAKADADGTRFIDVKVHKPQTPRHGKAYAGDWVLGSGRGKNTSFKVYLEKAFPKAFDLKAQKTNKTRRDAVELVELMTVDEPAIQPVVTFEDKPEPAAVNQVETATPSAAPSPAFLAALAKSRNEARS